MRELTESGGIGLAPTDWNQTGKVVPTVPGLYPLGLYPLGILFMRRPEGLSVRGGGSRLFFFWRNGITRAKFNDWWKMANFNHFWRGGVGGRAFDWKCPHAPFLPSLSVRSSFSKSAWPPRSNHSWSWYHQVGSTDDFCFSHLSMHAAGMQLSERFFYLLFRSPFRLVSWRKFYFYTCLC